MPSFFVTCVLAGYFLTFLPFLSSPPCSFSLPSPPCSSFLLSPSSSLFLSLPQCGCMQNVSELFQLSSSHQWGERRDALAQLQLLLEGERDLRCVYLWIPDVLCPGLTCLCWRGCHFYIKLEKTCRMFDVTLTDLAVGILLCVLPLTRLLAFISLLPSPPPSTLSFPPPTSSPPLTCYLNSVQERNLIKEIIRRMLVESHIKVYGVFLDVLNLYIAHYKEELEEWLFKILLRLLHKKGTDMLSTVHKKLSGVLVQIRWIPHDSHMGVTRPSVGVTRPSVGVTCPSVGVTSPSMGVTRSSVGVTRPSVGVTRQSVGVTCPSVGVTRSSVGVTRPSVGVTRPSVGVTCPSVGVTCPSMSVT